MPPWLSEYHSSEVPGSEGALEVSEVGDSDLFAADGDVERDSDLLDMTKGPNVGHLPSIHVDYDQFRKVC